MFIKITLQKKGAMEVGKGKETNQKYSDRKFKNVIMKPGLVNSQCQLDTA